IVHDLEQRRIIMNKIALFAFRGESMCFIHILLNAIQMNEKGMEVKIVLEGEATKLVPELISEQSFLNNFFKKAWNNNLIAGICKACAQKMGTLDSALSYGFNILEDMSGHAGMSQFIEKDYKVITL
ncbi:MAG TPA: hypothetical protein PKV92_08255, partial [Thermodesulfovibrio thiophilus]|nr:hypothetical protein [Thermodesulfovibrio thiophilus]